MRKQTEDSAEKAGKLFGQALNTLRTAPTGSERDALLADLALALVELGGSEPDTGKGLRLPWEGKTQPLLLAALRDIQNPDGRRQAVRAVSQRLLGREQTALVLTLVHQVYATPDAEKAAALSVVGLELLKANDRPSAEKAADEALRLYDSKGKPPPVRAEVVALALVLEKKKPPIGEGADEKDNKDNEHVGQVEGLARLGKWDEARRKAASMDFGEDVRFRALLALGAVAVDSNKGDPTDVEAAVKMVETRFRDRPELSWSLLRLTEIALPPACRTSGSRRWPIASPIALCVGGRNWPSSALVWKPRSRASRTAPPTRLSPGAWLVCWPVRRWPGTTPV